MPDEITPTENSTPQVEVAVETRAEIPVEQISAPETVTPVESVVVPEISEPIAPPNEISVEIPVETPPVVAETTLPESAPFDSAQAKKTDPEMVILPVENQDQRAQIPVNEPLVAPVPVGVVGSVANLARELLVGARQALQSRKRKKLDRIMALFEKQANVVQSSGRVSLPQVTNDEVEKLLHVSDATATRYLKILEKEGKIKPSVKTGKGVSYTKV